MNISKQSGYLGVGGKRVIGGLGSNTALDAYIRSLGPAAWFRMDQGVTVTGAGISQVDDLSGNARHLLDPGTTRPIYLPYAGTKYLYLPGVAGNFADSPDSAAVPTGDIDILVRALASDWTPSSLFYLVGKYNSSAGEHSFAFRVETTGLLRFIHSQDGTVDISAVSTSGPSLSDGVAYWLRVTRASASGDVIFYKAADSQGVPTSWTKVGNTVSTTAGAIRDSGADITIGAIENAGTGGPMMGNIYRAIIKNGIDGTTVVDFNPGDASDGASSFASSATGETWTVNSSGALPAQIVGRASALFNGTSHYLKCNAFTLNQPTCVLMVVKQVSWTAGERLCDGNTNDTGLLQQDTASPRVRVYAGVGEPFVTTLAVGSVGVLAAVYNSTSSSLRHNRNAALSGNGGTNNMGGFTLGARADGLSSFSNIQAYETVIFPIAPSTAQLDRLIAGLMARHGVA